MGGFFLGQDPERNVLATMQGAMKGPVILAVRNTMNSDIKWSQAMPKVHRVMLYILIMEERGTNSQKKKSVGA